MNLQDAGLFRLKDKKAPGYFDWQWEKIKTQLDLVDYNFNPQYPSNISYVFNGYSPISVKIIERLFNEHGLGNL